MESIEFYLYLFMLQYLNVILHFFVCAHFGGPCIAYLCGFFCMHMNASMCVCMALVSRLLCIHVMHIVCLNIIE